jgi:HEAT repeat protein
MSDDPKPPAKSVKPEPVAKPAAAAAPAAAPPIDERRMRYSELSPHAASFDANDLAAMLRDGRAVVRGNAALLLAAKGQPDAQIATLLRDGEKPVALAAADALAWLGPKARPLIPAIVTAIDGTLPEVTEAAIAVLADLIGPGDEELIGALDVPFELAMKSVVEACRKAGRKGVALLARGTLHERSRIRINAVGGLGRLGKTDPDVALAALNQIEANDPVPDARTAAKKAILAVVAREKTTVVDSLPKNIPDFEDRKLAASELAEYASSIDIDEMIYALRDGRNHVKINASRALAVKGEAAGRAAAEIGLLLRDSSEQVRKEAAKALGKLGAGALASGGDLVGALGDADTDVAEAAAETLEALGRTAQDALVKGLETGSESGGWRVGELIAKLPNATELLTEAFKSPAVNVQVNAALALGMLGKQRVGAGLAALNGARTGGDARTREAVRRALEMINPKRDTGPQAPTVEGFEDRFLSLAELDKAKAAVHAVGVDDLMRHLQDGRDVVRANAAAALGVLGPAAAPAARSIGVLLRDDAPRVRLAAAEALDKFGDAAVIETADDLVGALGDVDEKVAEVCSSVIRARKGRMISALVRGLESDKPNHGRRICELINVFDDAVDILCDAFGSPAVNVQVNAALGLGMLGKARVGKGRKALEGARTGGWEQTRTAVFKAIEMLDGPRRAGPAAIEVEGFETQVLPADAFKDPAKLPVGDLVGYLQDGRAIVRANAATALGAVGPAAKDAASAIAVLCRDDDMTVRIRAAQALDKLGDDVVRETAPFLVGALRGDAEVGKACQQVLGARKARVLGALIKGLETDDEAHARRILELINALPDACEVLCDAFASPAENVQVNAAIGIGMLGAKRAGSQGQKTLEGARTGGFARTREAVFKALAMLKAAP